MKKYLKNWYPEASFIFLSKYTKGAAFSALSAISFQDLKDNDPLIFDLADIYFETSIFPDFEKDFIDFSFIDTLLKVISINIVITRLKMILLNMRRKKK